MLRNQELIDRIGLNSREEHLRVCGYPEEYFERFYIKSILLYNRQLGLVFEGVNENKLKTVRLQSKNYDKPSNQECSFK